MPRYKSMIAAQRAFNKKIARLKIKHLKDRARPYDSLASKSRTLPGDIKYEYDLAETLEDIYQQVRFPAKRVRSRHRGLEAMISEIVPQEVKDQWHERIIRNQPLRLDDATREKLKAMVKNQAPPATSNRAVFQGEQTSFSWRGATRIE